MAHLVVMYKTPKDIAAFDKHYFEIHIPIAKKIPGLRKYEVSQGPVATPAGPSGFHLIATLYFDSLKAIQAGFASAEGKAAGADVQKFATGGVDRQPRDLNGRRSEPVAAAAVALREISGERHVPLARQHGPR